MVCYPRWQGKMSQEAIVEEVVPEMDQGKVRDEGAGVDGSAECDEREAKTQENPHHHPTR